MSSADAYRSIKDAAEFSITEKRSEFIGYALPVKTEEAAVEFVARIKKKHSDARHNVYAYIVREGNISRYSDDGEPHGTAGLPVIEFLQKSELTNVAVVVSRYFGGVLLGTGGLVRAYTAAAKGVVKEAKVVEYARRELFIIECDYKEHQKLDTLLKMNEVTVVDTVFHEKVTLKLAVRADKYEETILALNERTNGRVKSTHIGIEYGIV